MTAEDERAAYVALALTPGIGAGRLHALLAASGSATGALAAPFAFLCTVPGLTRAAATAVSQARAATGVAALAATEKLGARLLLPADAAFPAALRQIPDPPTLLFALGDLALLERPAVAVVGSRAHTAYGAAACRLVVADAVAAGLVVVSGLARGLDAVAHEHALALGGGTIGVLGNGLGVVYPAANRALYRTMAERGLILTEFAPGERPRAHTFPRRNRIISGLARVTVVVEAAVGSGALITAEAALEQGRDVLAVPGPITSPVSEGANRLLRDGAGPWLEADDLRLHFPELGPPARRSGGPRPAAPPPDLGQLGDEERAVATSLGMEPLHLDVLAERLGRPVAALLGVLCALEIGGIVEQLPGRRFRLVGG